MTEEADEFWRSVIAWVIQEDDTVSFPKFDANGTEVPRPEDSQFLFQSVGELKGQLHDWRASLQDDIRGFHAVEFADRYDCHLDQRDPTKDPLGHLAVDSPATAALAIGLGALAVGGLLYYLSRRGGGGSG